MKLLVTYFSPFGGDAANASAQAAELLPLQVGDWTLQKAELPVAFALAGQLCCGLLDELRPQAVLMLGQAGGRDAVTPELVARNLRYARIPDNAGKQPRGQRICAGGQDALFATLPVQAMTEAMCAAGFPARLSCSAGYYVCNDLYYTVLARLRGTAVPAAFVHLPRAERLSPERAAAALTQAIAAI